MERGKIYNIKRKQQINDFSKLNYGKITPTDIDGLIEYKNLCYIFWEVKYNYNKMPFGQQLAIERLINDLNITKPAIAFLVNHNIYDTNVEIDNSLCKVISIYYKNKKWQIPKKKLYLKEAIDKFINYVINNKKLIKEA